MFEAVHGSAPDIAGKDVANPSGLLHAATQMLDHIGEANLAETIKNAWLCAIESGIHTADIYRSGLGQREVGTQAFTDAVIERLGDRPRKLMPGKHRKSKIKVQPTPTKPARKELVGVDVFLDWSDDGRNPDTLGHGLEEATPAHWKLKMITNRGVKVYPNGVPETFWTDHWRCRFMPDGQDTTTFRQVLALLGTLEKAGFDVIKTEHLYTFDGRRAYSLGQGE